MRGCRRAFLLASCRCGRSPVLGPLTGRNRRCDSAAGVLCARVGSEDADQGSPRLNQQTHGPAPVEGSAQWGQELTSVIAGSMSHEAIDRRLGSNKPQPKGLSRERAELHAGVGEAIAGRREALERPPGTSPQAPMQPAQSGQAAPCQAGKAAAPERGGPAVPAPATERVAVPKGWRSPAAAPVQLALSRSGALGSCGPHLGPAALLPGSGLPRRSGRVRACWPRDRPQAGAQAFRQVDSELVPRP
jgi:hypothetical protein